MHVPCPNRIPCRPRKVNVKNNSQVHSSLQFGHYSTWQQWSLNIQRLSWCKLPDNVDMFVCIGMHQNCVYMQTYNIEHDLYINVEQTRVCFEYMGFY